MTALDQNAPDQLRGLESMCAALHAASETDPVVKEVAWRTFALIRAHREQSAEVDRLKAIMQNAATTAAELGAHAGMDVIVGYLGDAGMLPPATVQADPQPGTGVA